MRPSLRKQPVMPKPESGGKPKKITTSNKPGGPHTPGAKSEAGHAAKKHKGTGKVEASLQDNVKHQAFKNKSGYTENKTG